MQRHLAKLVEHRRRRREHGLAERLEGTGVTINAISPGFFVNTSIYRNLTGVFMLGAKVVFGVGMLLIAVYFFYQAVMIFLHPSGGGA